MAAEDNEEDRLRSVALKNAQSIVQARRRAEEELRKQSEWLRVTLASIGDAVISTDSDGRVSFVNRVAEILTGWPQAEALGHPLTDVLCIVDEKRREPVENPTLRALKEGVIVELADHTLLISKEGTHQPIDGSAAPIRSTGGDILGSVLILRDITESKQSEEALVAAQHRLAEHAQILETRVAQRTADLGETNEQLESFVYSIAHDLRAPLRAMTGFSQLLLEDHLSGLDETGQKLLRRIHAASEFMDQLLLDLLAFGRAARAEVELGPVEVQKAWAAALFQTAAQAEQSNAHIEVLGALPVLRAHEATLGQSLANLLSNALKFVATGVQPHIRFHSEEIASSGTEGGEGAHARLWVEDNGIGIPLEHQERAFRVFERLHGARYPGTGIGLSIVRKGVERMGGKVGVNSEPGKGSSFWIELPLAT